jgi:hypothetical protein
MDRSDMSRTKRIPIARQPSLQFSPRAIELFVKLERARKQRNALGCIAGDSGSGSGYCSTKCRACRDWYDLHNELHGELGLKP